MKKFTLPNKPSAILIEALKDFDAIRRRTGTYRIAMMAVHSARALDYRAREVNDDARYCQVCFAGSVIAKRTECGPDEFLTVPQGAGYNPTLESKLWFCSDVALGACGNDSRETSGSWKSKWKWSLAENHLRWDNSLYVDYKVNPRKWRVYVRDVVRQLQERGL